MKHKKMEPIKIGFSKKPTPDDRFTQMSIYSPFGCVLIGYILHESPEELEKYLHKKYESKRLNGEWFNIRKEEVINELLIHGNNGVISQKSINTEEIKNSIMSYINYEEKVKDTLSKVRKRSKAIKIIIDEHPELSQVEIARLFKISKQAINKYFKVINSLNY